jgi:hypothetical protein
MSDPFMQLAFPQSLPGEEQRLIFAAHKRTTRYYKAMTSKIYGKSREKVTQEKFCVSNSLF